jgi:putative transposase
MRLHRDSQKRFYEEGRAVFITAVTHKRHPYFEEDVFCELFALDLEFCRRLKDFQVIGYKINPDHVHLLIFPGEEYNYSEIMGSLKRNFSRDYNDLINGNDFIRCKGDDSNRRLYGNNFNEHIDRLNHLRAQFDLKLKTSFPMFKWQKSFHYHLIESKDDLFRHIRYIEQQWQKHNLGENRFLYISPEYGYELCDFA